MLAQKSGAKKGSRKLLRAISGGNYYQRSAWQIICEYLLTPDFFPRFEMALKKWRWEKGGRNN
ncbi:MAG: hypothetical protein QM594_10895 [Niabella sp.]